MKVQLVLLVDSQLRERSLVNSRRFEISNYEFQEDSSKAFNLYSKLLTTLNLNNNLTLNFFYSNRKAFSVETYYNKFITIEILLLVKLTVLDLVKNLMFCVQVRLVDSYVSRESKQYHILLSLCSYFPIVLSKYVP